MPGAGTHRGHDQLREFARRFTEVWNDLTLTAEEVIDAGDSVVVASRWRGSGRSSGTPVEALRWNVLTLREGKIVRRRVFQDRDAALKAAGNAE